MGKNKRSRSYYIQSAKRQKKGTVLGPDMVGFMCTCNYNERDCVREAYNVLNEFADKLYGKESLDDTVSKSQPKNAESALEDGKGDQQNDGESGQMESPSSSDDDEHLDIEEAIKAEVSELKNHQNKKQSRRFQQVQCGAKNCVFIQTTLKDPLPLSLAIMDELLLSQKQRTKKLLRMVPVQTTCRAYPEDIKKAVQELAKSYFRENGQSFCVIFKVRNNTSIKKENMVYDLATILETAHPKNRPNLNFPDVVLSVDIIKNVCCLGFLPHYFTKYSKYNLVLIANKDKCLVDKSSSNSDKPIENLDVDKDDVAVDEHDKKDIDANACEEKLMIEKKDGKVKAVIESSCKDEAVAVEKDEVSSQTCTENDVIT